MSWSLTGLNLRQADFIKNLRQGAIGTLPAVLCRDFRRPFPKPASLRPIPVHAAHQFDHVLPLRLRPDASARIVVTGRNEFEISAVGYFVAEKFRMASKFYRNTRPADGHGLLRHQSPPFGARNRNEAGEVR